ncbi:MAG: alpha/beta fold hydrolase [Methanobacterium sp.]
MKTFGTPNLTIYGMRRTPVWSTFESVAPTLAYDATIMGDGSIPREHLATVTVPTLIIDGELSPVWLHRSSRALMDTLPKVKHITLEGQTHAFEPEILAPVLQEFFTD